MVTGKELLPKSQRSKMQDSETFGNRRIVMEIVPASTFWQAEEYQQQFYGKLGWTGQ